MRAARTSARVKAAVWSAATCRRFSSARHWPARPGLAQFQSADMSAHSRGRALFLSRRDFITIAAFVFSQQEREAIPVREPEFLGTCRADKSVRQEPDRGQ